MKKRIAVESRMSAVSAKNKSVSSVLDVKKKNAGG